MRSLSSVLFVTVSLIQQAYTAALPSTADELSPLKGLAAAVNDASIKSAADGTPTGLPVGAFGSFVAHTLEEMVQNPDILDLGIIPGYKEKTSSVDQANVEDVNTSSLAATAAACTNPAIRYEWRNYQASDRTAFVNAISCLTKLPSANASFYAPSTSRYEDFVRTHQKMTPVVHGNGIFIFWHRMFLYTFEQALRTQCGFTQAMPWWDETKDAGRFHLSSLFTAPFFGTLPGPTQGSGTCVTDGRFANLKCNIGPGTGNVQHCLSRAVNETMTAQSSTSYVNYCAQATNTGAFTSCAETGPHAWAHNGIGSIMMDVYASPSDPIFFMHHLFIDHELASWQQVRNDRKQAVTGSCVSSNSPCANAVTLDTVLDMNGLRANGKVGDVLNTQSGFLCYKYDYYS